MGWTFRGSSTDPVEPFCQALRSVPLRAEQRIILEERFVKLVQSSRQRCRQSSVLFYINRTVVTVGSILVPAMLSIQYSNGDPMSSVSQSIYWTTWIVSLLVTMANGFFTMFKYDKKYYLLHASYEQLRSEGWQYLALTGPYKAPAAAQGASAEPTNSHQSQFSHFCQTVERIRLRQSEEEYIKLQDVNGATAAARPNSNAAQGTHSHPPSEMPNLIDMYRTPAEGDPLVLMARRAAGAATESSQPPLGGSGPAGNDTAPKAPETRQEGVGASYTAQQTGNGGAPNGRGASVPVHYNVFAAGAPRGSLL